jgi:hypothetical protein
MSRLCYLEPATHLKRGRVTTVVEFQGGITVRIPPIVQLILLFGSFGNNLYICIISIITINMYTMIEPQQIISILRVHDFI